MAIPEMVWVIGKSRELGEHSTPIVGIGEDGERVGVAPLTVLDPDGERAMPVYSTIDNAHKGIKNLMSEEEKGEAVVPESNTTQYACSCWGPGRGYMVPAQSIRVLGDPSLV